MPSPGYANNDEKTFALIAHFGGAAGALVSAGFFGFVAPLIAYLAKGQQSPTIRAHAIAALNFQALWSLLAFVIFFPAMCLAFIPSIIIVIFQIVVGVIAGIQATEGRLYKYPLSPSFIK
ncbi:MAG: DUF4870 domain-containing protein [Dactylosporangium sp.]|nr:DUF4870 domain-containing protein [Dactylosporangium sp.]NNJ63568.1 DUF4870 domain-containing protein [Dactylosporangium sp.]